MRASEQKYRSLFQNDITGNYVAKPDGTLLLCNAAFAHIFGFANVEDALKTNVVDALGAVESWPAILDELRRGKHICRRERDAHRRDGAPIHIVENIVGSFDDHQQLVEIQGHVFDDTERKRAELALQQINESLEQEIAARTAEVVATSKRLQAILDTSFSAIITIDERGVIQTANPAAERMFGYAMHELIGQNVEILAPPPYREELTGYIARYVESGASHILGKSREVLAQRADGSVFPAELAVSEISHMGLFAGVIGDITERKLLRQRLIEVAEEEQRRFGQELHDVIGQELTGLSMFASTLSSLLGDVPPEEGEGIPNALPASLDVCKIRKIVNRLLQGLVEANRHVHELGRGIMPVQVDAHGLNAALEELATATRAEHGIGCRFECGSPVEITSNSTATNLYRIAKEAVNNALEHGHGDQIEISVAQSNTHIILEVHDNGAGFDPNATHDAERKPSGMGLQIMSYRASVIDGVLQVDSRRGFGTVVRCSIPRKGDSHGG